MRMTNCPNCGAPLEANKCKCEYCGTWYFDLTVFDMSDDKPYYIKFRTPYGVITTRAIPELRTIELYEDSVDTVDMTGTILTKVIKTKSCDLNVMFHSVVVQDGNLYTLEINR